MHIAAACVEAGEPKHLFMPEYLLLPLMISGDPTIDFSKPVLDSFGAKLIMASLKMLTPDLLKGGNPRVTP